MIDNFVVSPTDPIDPTATGALFELGRLAEGVTLTYPGQTAPTLTPAERVVVRQRTRFLVLDAIYKRAHGQCGQPVNACPLFQLLLIDADAVDAAIAYCATAGYIARDEPSDIDTTGYVSPEPVIGLFKTEVIRHAGLWKGLDDVKLATLERVWRFNHHRLMEPLGYLPPAEFEEQ